MAAPEQATQSLIEGFRSATDSGWLQLPCWWPSSLGAAQDPLLLLLACLVTGLLLLSLFQNFRISRGVKHSLSSMNNMESAVAEQLRAGLQSQRAAMDEAKKSMASLRPDMDKVGKASLSVRKQLEELEQQQRESFSQLTTSLHGESRTSGGESSAEVLAAIRELRVQAERNTSLLDDLLALERAVTKMIGAEKVARLIEKERRLKPAATPPPAASAPRPPAEDEDPLLGRSSPIDDDLIPRNRR